MHHLEAHSGIGDPDQPLTATPLANTQQTECRILYPPPHSITSITSIVSITSIANIGYFDDAFSTTHKPGSEASYYSITSPTKTSPQPSSTFSQASNPGQTIEQAQLADLFYQLYAKQQKVVFLEFEKQKLTSQLNCNTTLSEHKEQNKKLQEDVIALQTGIKEKDDCYNKVVMARNSLQTEIDNLNKKNTELQGEKAELIQQRKQLQEDAENNLITAREAQGAEPDPAEPNLIDLLYDEDDTIDIFSTPEDRNTSNSHHSSEFLTQNSQTKKDAAVSNHDGNENIDNVNETTLPTLFPV